MAHAIPFLVICLVFTASGVGWAYCLKLGARWAKIEGVTFSRALFLSLAMHLIHGAISFADLFGFLEYQAFPILALLPVAALIFELCFLKWALSASLWQTFKSWLPTLLNTVVVVLLTLLIVRPFVVETFVIPTNSMAPAILGEHFQATCPTCGATAYTDMREYAALVNYKFPSKTMFICENYHIFELDLIDDAKPGAADRIVANKLVKPKRWDAIVFRWPEDRTIKYVKRLVGLPGETIQIRDGGIWIDGERLEPPKSIENISYVSELGQVGHGAQPLTLANDEYFVLGDFTKRAKDSRFWANSQIRPMAPYAVVQSEVFGVATHTYGNRWTSLVP